MFYIFLAVVVFVADTITKIAAAEWLKKIGTIPIINDIFHLTYVENRGMAFGMFKGGRIGFIIATILIMAVLVMLFVRTKKGNRTAWLKGGTALVLSGAVGNLTERIFEGFVIDFLDFRIINFPVFNIADIAVCVGAAMLIIHFFGTES